ncbi:MAG: hypothetical protein ACLTK0_01000 [Anaerovoracaceae bacterium]
MRLLARRVSAFICGSCADRVVCRRYGADSACADHHRFKKQDRISAGFRVEFFHFYCCRSEVSFRNHLHLLSAALFTVMLISLFLIKESMISDSYSPAAGKTASPADKKTKKKILSIDLFAMFSGASAAAIVPSVREIISGVKEAAFSVQDTVFPIRETVFPLISPLPLAPAGLRIHFGP